MKLSELRIGSPFILRLSPDEKPRVFYRLYMHVSRVARREYEYECYEVVDGCLQTPAFMIPAGTIVEPYEFKKT